MTDELVHDVGERARFHRLAARKTQLVVTGLAGITGDLEKEIQTFRDNIDKVYKGNP